MALNQIALLKFLFYRKSGAAGPPRLGVVLRTNHKGVDLNSRECLKNIQIIT
jgi:hypothetical protein